jgi:hypothetical protein
MTHWYKPDPNHWMLCRVLHLGFGRVLIELYTGEQREVSEKDLRKI